MRTPEAEIRESIADIEWWRKRRPEGWGMEGMTGREYATFVSPDGRRVQADGELLTALATSLDVDKFGKMRFALQAVDHTLSVHDHIDANTPLHEVVQAALS